MASPRLDSARRSGAIVVLAAVLLATAGCLPQIETPGSTALIQQIGSTTADGYRYDFYRNTAYPCAISGYQTFVVGTRFGSQATAPRPLWAYLHGGGVGYFDPNGAPMPGPEQKNEESAASLRAYLTNNGLMAKVRADAAAFRTLAVSYCSHDLYAGVNSVDPYNPNLGPDGAPRTTNGALATKAAIQFVNENYATTSTFLHGTSAGSGGSFAVAWALQLQGIAPAGIVADASVAYRDGKTAAYAAGACNEGNPVGLAAVESRVHPTFADQANDPDLLVTRGELTVPIMHIWNHADQSSCGAVPIACPLRDSSIVTLGVTDCYHEPLRRAIDAQGPSGRSRNLPLCVDLDPVKDCSTHVVTNRVGAVNTDPASPVDYLTAIIDWVDVRLTDP